MELSSNWKALQKRIQQERTSSNGLLKRKQLTDKPHISHKRTKVGNAKNSPHAGKHGMGGTVSKSESESKDPLSNGGRGQLPNGSQNPSNISVASHASQNSNSAASISSTAAKKYVSLDCEMVGVGPTPEVDSVLARVSVVNYHGVVLYDTFVLPPEGVKVTDYRTAISGIRPEHLKLRRKQPGGSTTNGVPATQGPIPTHAEEEKGSEENGQDSINVKGQPLVSLRAVQGKLDELLTGRVLIGHALRNDFHSLYLSHPHAAIRDTSRYPPFRALAGGRTPSLRRLAKQLLGREIQAGEHSSVEDAKAAMDLFKSVRKEWESGLRPYKGNGKKGPAKGRVINEGFGRMVEQQDDETEDEDEDGEDEDEDEDEEGDKEIQERKARRKMRLKKKKTKTKKRTKRA